MKPIATDIIKDAFDTFRSFYVQSIRSSIVEARENDEMETVIEMLAGEPCITADALTRADMFGYDRAREEYSWRVGGDTLETAFLNEGASIYDSVDYAGLIAEALAL
jgi:hypothetical protein